MVDDNMENWDFNNISQEERARIREEIDSDIDRIMELSKINEDNGYDDEDDGVMSMWVDLDNVDDKINEFKNSLYNDSINAIIPYSMTFRKDIYSQAVYWLRHYDTNKFVYNMSYFMYFANLAEVCANFSVMLSEILNNTEININFKNYHQYEDKFRLNKQMKYIRGCFDILYELYHSDNTIIKEKVNEYLQNFSEGNLNGKRCPFLKILRYRRKIEKYYKKQYMKALHYAIGIKLKENDTRIIHTDM